MKLEMEYLGRQREVRGSKREIEGYGKTQCRWGFEGVCDFLVKLALIEEREENRVEREKVRRGFFGLWRKDV